MELRDRGEGSRAHEYRLVGGGVEERGREEKEGGGLEGREGRMGKTG